MSTVHSQRKSGKMLGWCLRRKYKTRQREGGVGRITKYVEKKKKIPNGTAQDFGSVTKRKKRRDYVGSWPSDRVNRGRSFVHPSPTNRGPSHWIWDSLQKRFTGGLESISTKKFGRFVSEDPKKVKE